tara:strand:+ start:348 stop:587 length:240 start_codon:yes stop_codon:yes gene_type:complete
MAMLNDPNGGPGMHIDMNNAVDMVCEKCGNKTFKNTNLIKTISAIVSPSGKEMIIPIPVFACDKCGHVNEEFLKNEFEE